MYRHETLDPRKNPRGFLVILFIFGMLEVLGFQGLLFGFDAQPYQLSGLFLVWVSFLGIVYFVCRPRGHVFFTSSPPMFWLLAIGFALLFRAQAIIAIPFLADDYQRYIFDGKLLLEGVNPYAVIPRALPELGGAYIPKPEIGTIYPPLAEGLFAITVWFGGTLLHWRLMNLLPDLLGAWLFYQLLKQFQLPTLWLLLWLWNPLIIKEGLHAGHLDIWTLLFVFLFVYFAHRGCLKLAALSLAGAVLVKLIPLLILPAWLTQLKTTRDRIHVTSIVTGSVLFGFAWFLPWHPFGNIAIFLQQVQGYGVLFYPLSKGFGAWGLNPEWAKWLINSLSGAIYLNWVFIQKRYSDKSSLYLLEIFLLFFVCSNMGFPWYLLVVLPWVLINANRLWLVFIGLSQLNFYAHQFHQPSTTLSISLLLVLILAIYQKKE